MYQPEAGGQHWPRRDYQPAGGGLPAEQIQENHFTVRSLQMCTVLQNTDPGFKSCTKSLFLSNQNLPFYQQKNLQCSIIKDDYTFSVVVNQQ